jgi:hypothetical protein
VRVCDFICCGEKPVGHLYRKTQVHLLTTKQKPVIPTDRIPTNQNDCLGIRAMGIRDLPISPRSPWQSPYAERLIGTLRRECLDHVLIVGERHLRRMLASYSSYYNDSRTHFEEGCAVTASYPAVRSDHHHPNSFRTAPSLCADMIFGKDNSFNPHSPDNALSFGVTCAIQI